MARRSPATGRKYEGIGAIEAGQRLAAAHALYDTVARALNNLSSFLRTTTPAPRWRRRAKGSRSSAGSGEALVPGHGQRSHRGLCGPAQWDWALAELEPMLSDEIDPVIRLVAIADSILLRASRGEASTGCWPMPRRSRRRSGDLVKPATIAYSHAALGFIGGRFDVGRREALRFGEIFPAGTGEASVLAAHCDILAGDPGLARKDLALLEATPRHGRAIDNDHATILAGIAALEGRTAEAMTGYRQALGVWRDLGLVWDEAMCAIDMATVLDPSDPEVVAAAETARSTLVGLGATPFVERLDAALARSRPAEPARERCRRERPEDVRPVVTCTTRTAVLA